MNDWLIAVFIGLVIGLVLGVKIARDSHKRQPVVGGIVGQALHYLACSGLTSVLPFIIAGIVVGLPFLQLFGTGVGLLALTAVFLVIYALIERSTTSTPPKTKPA
jgi:hypothetical protein